MGVRKVDFDDAILARLEAEAFRLRATLSGLVNMLVEGSWTPPWFHPGWCSPEPHPTLELQRGARSVPGFVYVMLGWWPDLADHKQDRLYKIGFSVNPLRRLEEIAKAEGAIVELVLTIPTADMRALESRLHGEHKHCRERGEWFRLSDAEVANLRRLAESES